MGIYEGTFKTPTPYLPSLSTLSTHHQGPMYDSVFVLSSGRVTSIGPQGEFNWQVNVHAKCRLLSLKIYSKDSEQDMKFFALFLYIYIYLRTLR